MSEEKCLVVTEMGEKEDVKEMCVASLSDSFDHHMEFVKGVTMLVNDCSMGKDGLGSHINLCAVLSEAEDRLDYIKIIGDEMYRRLAETSKEKPA